MGVDDLICPTVKSGSPTTAGVSFRARSLLVLPIYGKLARIEARVLRGLPSVVLSRWTHQIKVIVLLALHQEFCIDISSIHDMLGG